MSPPGRDSPTRAAALGFDVTEPVFHGTRRGPITRFVPRRRRTEQVGFGVHVTPTQELARLYAYHRGIARPGHDPVVLDCLLRKGRTLAADRVVAEGSEEFALGLALARAKARTMIQRDALGIPCLYLGNALDAADPARAERTVRDAGYDTVRYQARVRDRAGVDLRAICYAVLDPAQLRRTDAAFDPARRASHDLLA